jgi:hypothetical protein
MVRTFVNVTMYPQYNNNYNKNFSKKMKKQKNQSEIWRRVLLGENFLKKVRREIIKLPNNYKN